MIASLHYYGNNNYKISKNKEASVVKQIPFRKSVAYTQNKPYNLSTAYKESVISYARELSDTVNNTKTVSNETIYFLDEIRANDEEKEKKGSKKKDENYLVSSAKKSLSKLAETLNSAFNFKTEKSQSEEFDSYFKDIVNIVENSISLGKIGFKLNNGNFEIDEEFLEKQGIEESKILLKDISTDIKDIYSNTSEFLSKPLSEHMSFKSFSYYFSYSAGIVKNDSFSLIGRGTLLNLEL